MATLEFRFLPFNNAYPGLSNLNFIKTSTQNRLRVRFAPVANFPVSFRQNCIQIVKFNDCQAVSLVGNKLGMSCARKVKSVDSDRKMFDDIPERTLPAYLALIRMHCQSEKWDELFAAFRLMVDEGFLPDKYLVPTILKASSKSQMLKTGKMVHGYVIRKMLMSDNFIGNALLDFYGNCGALRSSINVFESMTEKDVVSWTGLVSAYVKEGLLNEATEVFESMQLSGLKPDLISWNALVAGFARYGEIDIALQHLVAMQQKGFSPRVNSWNGIISGCVQNGYFKDALDVFYDMLSFPENPNSVTVASILPACAGSKDLDLGKAIHAHALKCGLCANIYVEGSLVDMYSKCGLDDHAEKVFARAEKNNIGLWNEIIAAHVNQGNTSKALEHFRSMRHIGLKPDVVTYNTLLAGYAKNGQKFEAYKLLSEMLQEDINPNVVSFNVLVSGFQQSGLTYEALKLFQAMLCNGCFLNKIIMFPTRPNSITITAALAACADLNLWHKGKEIHGYMLRGGFEDNHFISSALIDVYMKCYAIDSAIRLFRIIKNKNEVCWNALIAGHVNIMQPKVAIERFCDMLVDGIKPSSVTFSILLPALSERADLKLGRQLHSHIIKNRLLESSNNLSKVLNGMYTKCG